jgi:DNA-binding response OmpR family regulator
VENDPGSARTFEAILSAHGHTVRIVSNAETALREVDRDMPTIALVDFHLPLANGLEFLRWLRSRGILARLPVALMTGDYLLDDRVVDELQALGVPLHFKPLWEEDLLQVVESLLARRENCPAAAK